MKKYFAKYLPVEGEIKVGDKIRSESCSKHAVTVTEISDNIYWTDERDFQDPTNVSYFGMRKEKAVKLSPLMLCSRDIQVGDEIWSEDFGLKKYRYTETIDFSDNPVPSYSGIPSRNTFKVIGEISPNAKWVKEGDEFDRDQLKIWKSCDSYSSKIITEAMGGKWEHEEDSIIVPGKVEEVEVKCPCCETFK